MNSQEKFIARILFKNKIHEANGQAFEDIFTSIMNYYCADFQQIKPWGNIGDRKNDGYIKSEATYFQVYAPENIEKSYVNLIKKIKTDFSGLLEQWKTVSNFYFVVNDKYKGINPDCAKIMDTIRADYNLNICKFLTAKDIENRLFELMDDQIFTITGPLPDPNNLKHVDYSILNEVISYIMQLPIDYNKEYKITLPDLDEKIQFNGLSNVTSKSLYNGLLKVVYLEKYLSNNSNFVADSLRDKLNNIYLQEKKKYNKDELFWNIVNKVSPKQQQYYQITAIIIMAKYFESCDIFEEPTEGEKI